MNNPISRLLWRLGIFKPSMDRLSKNVANRPSLCYNGYCAVCDDDNFSNAPMATPNILTKIESGNNCDWTGKCKTCGTKYFDRWMGISEDEEECDESEKYVFLEDQRRLIGTTKNFNRENMSHQVFV